MKKIDETAEEWVKRLYPDGNIDFCCEHGRLLSVIKQYMRCTTSHATKSVLLSAIKCGDLLQSKVVDGWTENFWDLNIGEHFEWTDGTKDIWIKTGERTARAINSSQVWEIGAKGDKPVILVMI